MPVRYARLLVVSDDKAKLAGLDEPLRALELYGVTVTNSLVRGQHLLENGNFDVVLIDIDLAHENREQACVYLQSEVPVPVIVIGFLDQMEMFNWCLERGAADFLILPVSAAQLKARVQVHVQKRRLQEQALTALEAFNEIERVADDLRLIVLPLGIALAAEEDDQRLLERIVETALDICDADGGALLLFTPENTLRYAVVRVRSLGIAYGGPGSEPVPFADVPLYDQTDQPHLGDVAAYVALERYAINLPDVFEESSFDATIHRNFDAEHGYKTVSSLTVPMEISDLSGVLQLVNALDPETGLPIPFGAYQQLVAESLAGQAAVVLHNRALRQRETGLLRYKRELEIGRLIQADFFPEQIRQLPGWQLLAHFEPAREVAGDFYDVLPLPSGKLGLIVGDVCHKGVMAALFMALLRSLIRALVQQHHFLTTHFEYVRGTLEATLAAADPFTAEDRAALLDALQFANAYLGSNHGKSHIFASLFFGILEPETGQLLYANCGHLPPYVVGESIPQRRLMPTGPALGLLPNAIFKLEQTQLEPGETLFVYTDGVTEARTPEGGFFGEARLRSFLEHHAHRSAAEMLETLLATLRRFTAGGEPHDDMAMLLARRSP